MTFFFKNCNKPILISRIESKLLGIARDITDVQACELAMEVVKERMRILGNSVEIANSSINSKMFE